MNLDNSFVKSLYFNKIKLGIIPAIVFALLFICIIFISFYFEVQLYTFALIVALSTIPFFILYPQVWIYTVLLFTLVFFSSSEGGFSIFDALSGVFLVVGLFLWFIYHVLVQRRKLISNFADWMILFYFLIIPFTFLLAYLNEVPIQNSSREYAMNFLILYLFPIKEYIKTKKQIQITLIIWGLSVFTASIYNFYQYYVNLGSGLQYAYQLLTSVRINQSLFTAGTISSVIFLFFVKSIRNKLIIFLLAAISLTALIISFSRTFWFILLLQIIIVFFVLPKKEKIQMIISVLFMSVFFTSIVFIFFNDKAQILLQVVGKRFESSGKGTQDLSAQSRLEEWKVVVSKTEQYPFGGNGYSKEFAFLNPIDGYTAVTNIIHNGYLFYFYRVGIPAGLVFIFIVFYHFSFSGYLVYKSKDKFYKYTSLAVFNSLFLLIFSNWLTPQFIQRDCTFIMAFVFAYNSIIYSKLNKNEENLPIGESQLYLESKI